VWPQNWPTTLSSGELLGLEETEEQVGSVYIADYLLGRLHQRDYRVRA
jgi:hypothetical protein